MQHTLFRAGKSSCRNEMCFSPVFLDFNEIINPSFIFIRVAGPADRL